MTSIETYVAGFGGYTFGGKFSDVEGAGLLPGVNLGDRDLADAESMAESSAISLAIAWIGWAWRWKRSTQRPMWSSKDWCPEVIFGSRPWPSISSAD